MMKRVIINADDCGISKYVNDSIENAIRLNKISSTSIMANMSSFEGAVALFNQYRDCVSFGFHLNLSEGVPIRYSQYLLDIGFYIEKDNEINFNGIKFLRRFLDNKGLIEIEKEIDCQICKILDNGVKISHIDGHQHIHTANFMLCLLPKILEKYKINKVRNIRNLMPISLDRCIRDMWSMYIKNRYCGIVMTDIFCSYTDYYNNHNIRNNRYDTIELMCHPGHDKFKEEEILLLNNNILEELNLKMITYTDL